jgi:hypothetical protein
MKLTTALLTTALFITLAQHALADRRYFARSYTAYTLPARALEFELWNTGRFGKDVGYFYRFQPRVEFEYGISDRFSGSIYLNFDQRTSAQNTFSSKPLTLSSTAFECRYRLAEMNEYFVDPALYFEFSYGGEEIEYETRMIFSKRHGNWVGALNLTGEVERKVIAGAHETKFEILGGLAYECTPALALGAELRNSNVFESFFEETEGKALFAGPTVSVQTDKFSLTFNASRQLWGSPNTKDGLALKEFEQWDARMIVGIAL